MKTYVGGLVAMVLITGQGAGNAKAQTILEVGGAGTIGDTTLTTANVPAGGVYWTTDGGGDGDGSIYARLNSPTLTVQNAGDITLTFEHRYNFENDWDGGTLYISVNAGAWTHVPALAFSSNGYVKVLASSSQGGPFPALEEVYTDKSTGYDTPAYLTSIANLGTFAVSDTIAIQFRGGWDWSTTVSAPNWEIATVKVTDSTAAVMLDTDFLDGPSGFTDDSDTGLAGPWRYLQPISRFEINADTLSADRYLPASVGSVIDLNDAMLEVVLLAGTLDAGDSFSLFDVSGGTTLTGSVKSISLPTGTWDTSDLGVNGTITCQRMPPPLVGELGILDLSANGGINPNTGFAWKVGDQYRLAFHAVKATGTRDGTSNDPADYNAYVTAEAQANPALAGSTWFALVCVNLDSSTTQELSAKSDPRVISGTDDQTGGSGQGGAGVPVYVMDGTTCIARNNADIWNTWSNPFETSVGVADPTGNGNNVVRVAPPVSSQNVHYSPFLDQFGNQTVTPDDVHGIDVATGCGSNGAHINALGNTTDNTTINRGNANANNTGRIWNRFTNNTTDNLSFYAISEPLTVRSGAPIGTLIFLQ